ncbi:MULTISPECIES: anaerobic sulfatase maturase [Paenibacillus]|uniref:Anaerobic sulfatase maturase n=1 Tax=Paenibacillus campinasensis TaxID=66347 RepID=A0A268F045_9BACL|nr:MULTISPECIES: anaerobic sulfatase maturase [Paenibacillus]MUG66376.1 anaerobic sulfatase maturase [Paenibacillus campinasensis]PAD78755.1 anaerobic sulfatase maturase [Paenibacillus campinasensis]PAK54427.1 anaerobic sulfatase maturase [Paenibacillus sp. 7541]
MSGGCRTSVQSHINVMWKTVSEDCNLACDYCYYSTCGGKPGPEINRIDSAILDTFIKDYMQRSRGAASFAWQGGEPLLAGLAFFEEVVYRQALHAPPHTTISNSLQTNGTLIHDRWASFFKTYHFLIGVSLDGPKEIHDARRVNAAGRGSFDRVMAGIGHLRKHQVDFNILTVIHKGNVGHAKELLAFYREHDFNFVQFIPCMDFRSQQVDRPGVYEITPREYGDFLCDVFDVWYNDGHPNVSIRFFDNMLSVYVNREAELCVHRAACPTSLVLEQNGDAYPCDFFINDAWKLGNAGSDSIADMLAHPNYARFHRMKPALPDKCRSCTWQKLCHGGCPRNRQWNPEGTTSDPDFFCQSYVQIYAYAHDRMTELGDRLRRELYSSGVKRDYAGRTPGRNEPCPCGSGKKHKACCASA